MAMTFATSKRWPVASSAIGAIVVTATLLSNAINAGPAQGEPKAVGSASGTSDWPLTECGTYSGKGCSPTAKRVDLKKPTFSNPTNITNPLFPISRLHSQLQLGTVDGKPFRSESVLLPEKGTVSWDGKQIRVVLQQYLATVDGAVEEIAIDRYAQADDGSVWYFGEDVYDYRAGAVAVTEGTWLAGRDGPPAMIMPAQPKIGDVFRAENIIGVVFEELEVTAVNRTFPGPRGPVKGAIVAKELHLDGSHSDKIFAPGYGEFHTASNGELEALAVAVPTDALSTPVPTPLIGLTTAAWGILENARLHDWEAAEATVKRMNVRWQELRSQNPPPMIAARMTKSLATLAVLVRARKVGPVTRVAIDVAESALDLQLRHRPPVEVDIERIHLHSQQLRVNAAAKDAAGVAGEVALIEWHRDRITGVLKPEEKQAIDTSLRALRGASDARNLPAAADHAARFANLVRERTAAS